MSKKINVYMIEVVEKQNVNTEYFSHDMFVNDLIILLINDC